MGHKRTKINNQTPDASGNVTLTSDHVSEGSTNQYYTDARIDAKIGAASVSDFSDVADLTSATEGQVLKRSSGGIWTPADDTSGGASSGGIIFLGEGADQDYPYTGVAGAGNIGGTSDEPFEDDCIIEFYGSNIGTSLDAYYDLRTTNAIGGDSSNFTLTAASSFTSSAWVRSISNLPVGLYLVSVGVAIDLTNSTSWLEYRVYVDGVEHSSIAKVSADTEYPNTNFAAVQFTSAPSSTSDNKIDVRVVTSSGDLETQGKIQAQRGGIRIIRVRAT